MYDYYVQVNQWRIDPSVVRRLCDEAGAALEWLVSLGVKFPVKNLKRSGMETVARGHQPDGRGAEIAEQLERAVKARAIDVALGNRVEKLFADGAMARGERLRSGALVIASGGFGQNRALIDRYYPKLRARWGRYLPRGARATASRSASLAGRSYQATTRGCLSPRQRWPTPRSNRTAGPCSSTMTDAGLLMSSPIIRC